MLLPVCSLACAVTIKHRLALATPRVSAALAAVGALVQQINHLLRSIVDAVKVGFWVVYLVHPCKLWALTVYQVRDRLIVALELDYDDFFVKRCICLVKTRAWTILDIHITCPHLVDIVGCLPYVVKRYVIWLSRSKQLGHVAILVWRYFFCMCSNGEKRRMRYSVSLVLNRRNSPRMRIEQPRLNRHFLCIRDDIPNSVFYLSRCYFTCCNNRNGVFENLESECIC